MLAYSPLELLHHDDFLQLPDFLPHICLNLKLEGLNIAGSIKIKPAIRMIEQLEISGRLHPGGKIIESSSGNLGLALSIVCAVKGYQFTCISDPNISPQTAQMIQAYGAELIVIREKDQNGGYLGKRLELIDRLLKQDPQLIWLNQYQNLENIAAHYQTTAREILCQFPHVDFLFVGAGTTGTLGGISRYFSQHSPETKIIAVDSVGSVTFGGKPSRRHIPGLGTSNKPPISEEANFDELIMIPETETVQMCLKMAKQGILLGGSSGTILCAVNQYANKIFSGATVVAISPDMGDRYIDTIYNPQWINDVFPQLSVAEPLTI